MHRLSTTQTAASPIELQRFTTLYNPRQDRIQLSGTPQDSTEQHTLWLTQRLLRLLLPALWQWLERSDSPTATATPLQEPHRQALHSLSQQAACAQLQTTPTQAQAPHLTPPLQGGIHLAHGAQLSANAAGVELTFDCHALTPTTPGTDRSICIRFTALPLRQWLAILYQLHQQAEWLCLQWPAWMNPEQPQPMALLH